jgi:hypothetical protein
MTDSDVETGSAAYIGNRLLRIGQELATATRGRVLLVTYINSVRTSQETQYIFNLGSRTLTTRLQRLSLGTSTGLRARSKL